MNYVLGAKSCYSTLLQGWNAVSLARKANLQEVSHPLLSTSDERTNVRGDALGRAENDLVSPGCRHQACHKGIVTTRKK